MVKNHDRLNCFPNVAHPDCIVTFLTLRFKICQTGVKWIQNVKIHKTTQNNRPRHCICMVFFGVWTVGIYREETHLWLNSLNSPLIIWIR
jgi:hypothetical protein